MCANFYKYKLACVLIDCRKQLKEFERMVTSANFQSNTCLLFMLNYFTQWLHCLKKVLDTVTL